MLHTSIYVTAALPNRARQLPNYKEWNAITSSHDFTDAGVRNSGFPPLAFMTHDPFVCMSFSALIMLTGERCLVGVGSIHHEVSQVNVDNGSQMLYFNP
jgi:hypothetical protein